MSDPSWGETLEDGRLIEQSIGRPELFATIFDRHHRAIHAYLSRRVGAQAADDLLSDVFVAAFEGRVRYDAAFADARPWLYGIAGNVTKRHFRNSQRRLDLHDRLPHVRDVDGSEEIVTRLDAARTFGPLAAAVRALSAGDRDALLLFAWEELSYEEIAQAMGIPVGTVRSRLNRARRLLRGASTAGEDGR